MAKKKLIKKTVAKKELPNKTVEIKSSADKSVNKRKIPGKILTVGIIQFFFAFSSLIVFIGGLFTLDLVYIILGGISMIIYVLIGIGLFFFNNSARIFALVLSWVAIASSVYNMLDSIYVLITLRTTSMLNNFQILISLILAIIIIVCLKDKEVKKQFK